VFYISGGYLEVQNMVKVLADTVQRAAGPGRSLRSGSRQGRREALNEKGADFDTVLLPRLAEAAAQLRTVQQIRKKFGG
jgi:F-type H+-transporting ATPase subunit epsilon